LQVLGSSVALFGLVGVFCSVMVYVVTGREFWSLRATAAKFAMTSAELGIAATWLSILIFDVFDPAATMPLSQQAGATLLQSLVVVAALKLTMEASLFRHLLSRRRAPLKRSAMLLVGPLSGSTFGRFACGILGGIVMPLFIWNDLQTVENHSVFLVISVAMLFVACLAGELLERYQFFAACAAARMPGQLNA
jgi:DMSO reductase anchor subunit